MGLKGSLTLILIKNLLEHLKEGDEFMIFGFDLVGLFWNPKMVPKELYLCQKGALMDK
jgi:hypothetical protein